MYFHVFTFRREILVVFDGLGDSSGVLTFKNNKWASTANIISFTFPCLHQYCHLFLNGSFVYWSTKIPTVIDFLTKKILITWPVSGDDCSSMTSTKLCRKHIHLQSFRRLYINVSIEEFSYTGHFSSHDLNHGGKPEYYSWFVLTHMITLWDFTAL